MYRLFSFPPVSTERDSRAIAEPVSASYCLRHCKQRVNFTHLHKQKWMSPFWFLLHLSLSPSLDPQRAHPETSCLDVACCFFLFVLPVFILFVRNIATTACSSVSIRNCHCLHKVKVGGGGFTATKKTKMTGVKKVCFFLLFFSGLPLRLVTAWKKKLRYFWYGRILFYFIRPTAAFKVKRALMATWFLRVQSFAWCVFSPPECHNTSCKHQNRCSISIVSAVRQGDHEILYQEKKQNKNMLTCLQYFPPKIRRDCFCFSHDDTSVNSGRQTALINGSARIWSRQHNILIFFNNSATLKQYCHASFSD